MALSTKCEGRDFNEQGISTTEPVLHDREDGQHLNASKCRGHGDSRMASLDDEQGATTHRSMKGHDDQSETSSEHEDQHHSKLHLTRACDGLDMPTAKAEDAVVQSLCGQNAARNPRPSRRDGRTHHNESAWRLVEQVLERIAQCDRAKKPWICSCRKLSLNEERPDTADLFSERTTLSRRCLSLDEWEKDGDAACCQDVERVLGVDKRSHVIVYVHGFRQRCDVIARTAQFLLKQESTAFCASPVVVIAFVWPSRLDASDYAGALEDAAQAGRRLRSFLANLREAGFARVSVLAHSLGARVALEALCGNKSDDQQEVAETRNDHPLVSSLFLIGAAVNADALSPHGEFPRDDIEAPRLVIFYSKNDEVLSAGTIFPSPYAFGQSISTVRSLGITGAIGRIARGEKPAIASKALGAVGPEEPSSAFECYDVSHEVTKHKASNWLTSPHVLQSIYDDSILPQPASHETITSFEAESQS